MREIKFRAWDKLRKEMMEVYEISFDAEQVAAFSKERNKAVRMNPLDDDFDLMQYTGLKDNSVAHAEIYEGDIIDVAGGVVGNIYESPQIQQEGVTHAIANMGTVAWRESESIAMGRGCKYAE